MAVDGSLTFDTRIDTDGFSDDIRNIVGELKGISASLKNMSRTISKIFVLMQSGAELSADTLNNVSETAENAAVQTEEAFESAAESIDGISAAADRAERSVENIEESVLGLNSENISILSCQRSRSPTRFQRLSTAFSSRTARVSLRTTTPTRRKQSLRGLKTTTMQLFPPVRSGTCTSVITGRSTM